MLLLLVVVTICQIGLGVEGARIDTVVVPSERYHSFQPRTVEALASRANLGINNGFRVESHRDVPTAKGVKLRRLVQTYGGYEVYGSVATAEVTMDGHYTGHVLGDVVLDLSEDIPDPEVCKRRPDDVIAVAVAAEGLLVDDSRVQEKEWRRIVYLGENGNKAVMAYTIQFFVDELISSPFYIIDACNYTIYTTYNLIQNSTNHNNILDQRVDKQACARCNPLIYGYGGNRKSRIRYGVAPKCLPLTKGGSYCEMSSKYVRVINNMGSFSRTKSNSIRFYCKGSYYKDPYGNKNGAYGVANDALYFGHMTGRMFDEHFRGYGRLAWTPRAVVHYGVNYQNAFQSGRDMFFGDGGSYLYPLVVIDVVAHEYAHAITRSNSRLEYREQSGGINEAFSDITGTLVRYYESGKYDWYFAKEAMKRHKAMRYMFYPPRDGRSIKHAAHFKAGMGVHYSSGVYNYAFYQLVQTYRMPIFRAYWLFLDSNLNRWGRTTGFVSGACHVVRSAYANGVNWRPVRDAFAKAGISTAGCRLNFRAATIYSGQKRSEILVSAERNPILEVSMDKGKSSITAWSEDGSEVKLVLATDEAAENIVDEKTSRLDIESSNDDRIMYILLKSSNLSDVKVTMQVN